MIASLTAFRFSGVSRCHHLRASRPVTAARSLANGAMKKAALREGEVCRALNTEGERGEGREGGGVLLMKVLGRVWRCRDSRRGLSSLGSVSNMTVGYCCQGKRSSYLRKSAPNPPIRLPRPHKFPSGRPINEVKAHCARRNKHVEPSYHLVLYEPKCWYYSKLLQDTLYSRY